MLKVLPNYIHFILLTLTSLSVSSQNTASASFNASVNIIKPIEIQTTSDMNFADIEVNGPGSVILNPDNSRITSGEVKLAGGTNVSAAELRIKGENNFSYDVTMPSGEFYMVNGQGKITLKDFTLSKSNSSIQGNTAVIKIGATIEVDDKPGYGTYVTPTPIEVIVSYN